jgi:hypothetical protein
LPARRALSQLRSEIGSSRRKDSRRPEIVPFAPQRDLTGGSASRIPDAGRRSRLSCPSTC